MTVHVVATGGTISSHFDGEQWTNLSGAALIDELGELPVDVEVHDVATGPSSNLSVDDMVRVAEEVRTLLAAGADGVVVVHGTDTMELTAFMTQLLVGTDADRRPVVFTGSMRVHSHPAPDGPQNLHDAITLAASADAVGRDVLVCLEGVVHAADRVQKRHAASVDAFDSFPFGPVGHVRGHTVALHGADTPRRPAAGVRGPVPLVVCHPGMTIEPFPAEPSPGVVVAGFGDLNVPTDLWGPMFAAAKAGIVVVVASQVFTPNTGLDLRPFGAAGAGGLTPQKARLALMAALGSTTTADDAVDFLHQYALPFDAGDRSTS